MPVESRSAKDGDVLIVDPVDSTGEAQRDYVVQLEWPGCSRRSSAPAGDEPGLSKKITYAAPEGQKKEAEATLKELKEPVLPSLDDELGPIGERVRDPGGATRRDRGQLHEAIEAELEADFRRRRQARPGLGASTLTPSSSCAQPSC